MRRKQVTVALCALLSLAASGLLASVTTIANVTLRNNQDADVDGEPITSGGRDVKGRVPVNIKQGTSVNIIFFAKGAKQPSVVSALFGLFGPSTVQASSPPMSAQTCHEAKSASEPGRYTFEGPGQVTIDRDKLTFAPKTCVDFDSKVTASSKGLTSLLHTANLPDATTRTLNAAREAEIACNLKGATTLYESLLGAGDESADWARRRLGALENIQRAPPAPGTAAKRGRALLVAISDYRWLPKGLSLPSARKDADLFYRFLMTERGGLGKAGDIVEALLDQEATASAIRLKLRQIADEVTAGETVYIFLTAHSMPLPRGDAGIVAYDTRVDIQSTALPFSEIAALLSDIQLLGGKVVLFADTCHAGLLQENPGSRRIVSLAAQFTGLVSSGSLQKAKADGHFTSALVSALGAACHAHPCGKVSLKQIKNSVAQALDPGQTPEIIGKEDGFSVDLDVNCEIDSSKVAPSRDELPSVSEAIASARHLLDEPGHNADDWRRRAVTQAVVLERLAQEPVLRYLGGEDFHVDDRNVEAQAFRRAADLFELAFRLRPDDPSLAARQDFCRARALLLKGDSASVGEASRLLDRAIASEPLASYMYNARGIALLEGLAYGDTKGAQTTIQAALREFQKSILLDPFWAYPRHNLALAYKAGGDDSQAVAAYQEGIAFSRFYGLGEGYLLHNLGALYEREQDWPRAQDAFEKAAKAFLDERVSFAGREQQAISEKEAATQAWAAGRKAYMANAQAEAINALGTVYAMSGADRDAAREFRRALAADKDSVEAHRNLGMLLLNRANSADRFTEALDHFHQVEVLMANDASGPPARKVQSLIDLGEFFLRRAEFDGKRNQDTSTDYQKATEYFGEAKRLAPDSAAAQDGMKRAAAGGSSR
jgi:tetratricopeptide (TPR) repeat protein